MSAPTGVLIDDKLDLPTKDFVLDVRFGKSFPLESVNLKLRTAARLRALRYAMSWKLPEQADLKVVEKRDPFLLRPEVTRRLESLKLNGVQHYPRLMRALPH